MPVAPALRSLDIDLPACPQVLVDLSLLLHDENADTRKIGGLIEADMALAAAVVRSVNSALFGLMRRVESVPEAVRFLGTREVAMLTYEIGLRAASKGHAVERLMGHAPFHGRKPIFIGDDFTDEAGMSMARRFGGLGLRVAEVFGGDPAQVRAWLTHGMERMDGRPPPPAVTPGVTP